MENAKTVALDHFIMVGDMSWGKGEDLREALTNWIRHARPRRDTVVHVRQVNKDAYVDGLGTLYAHKDSVKLPDLTVPEWLIRKLDDVENDVLELLLPIEDEVVYSKMGTSDE